MNPEHHLHSDYPAKCRIEVIEYGHCPVCPWLTNVTSISSLKSILRQLLQKGIHDRNNKRCFVSLENLADTLGISHLHATVLLDLFSCVLEDTSAIKAANNEDVIAVDAHYIVLFLFAQFYVKQASKSDTSDVWPVDHQSLTQMEPSSPMKLVAQNRESPQHRGYMPSTRHKMQEHLAFEESLINGFGPYIGKYAVELVAIIGMTPPDSSDNDVPCAADDDDVQIFLADDEEEEEHGNDRHGEYMSMTTERSENGSLGSSFGQLQSYLQPSQADRLGFLLEKREPIPSVIRDLGSNEDDNAPMDLCDDAGATTGTPMNDTALSFGTNSIPGHVWVQNNDEAKAMVSTSLLVQWIRESLSVVSTTKPPPISSSSLSASPGRPSTNVASGRNHTINNNNINSTTNNAINTAEDVAMLGASPPTLPSEFSPTPPRFSMFDQLISSHQAGSFGLSSSGNTTIPMGSLLKPLDVHGVHRATVLRGESDFGVDKTTNANSLHTHIKRRQRSIRIIDCHDAVVYCLAPIEHANIAGCVNCIIILGAVQNAVRVERCERVQVAVATQRIVLHTCHDCIFYLAVNRPPVLVGDNRFIQLAPHNAGYDFLADHIRRAGVVVNQNAWRRTTPLLPDQNTHISAMKHNNALIAGGGSYGGTSPPLSSPFTTISTSSMPALGAENTSPAPGHPPSAMLLAPQKLVPLLVPFTGGPGPMCGGPSKPRLSTANASFGIGMNDEDPLFGVVGGASGLGAEAFGPLPFSLPPEFAASWEERMNGMAMVRAAYRNAGLNDAHKREFIGAIQSHFKEWLQAGSGMRMKEVYDLARAEKEGAPS